VSQIAVSVGLFGTVVGIAQSFFARGGELDLAAPEVLASGLSTALFTTIAGLVVFLFGQGFLIAFDEWQAFCERDLEDAWAPAETGS
jgi:biopolymer transport protein ExbB/TolQ